jgi:hypothetical protein
MSTPTQKANIASDNDYKHLLEEINSPSLTTEDEDVNRTIFWVINLITLLLNFIETTFKALHQGLDARIAALENVRPRERTSAAVATTRSQTKAVANVPAASTSRAEPAKSPGSPDTSDDDEPVPVTATPKAHTSRCETCHAIGHDKSKCRTTDPAAMRKRVALNRRKQKEARKTPLYFPATVPAPSYTAFAPPAAMDPRAYAALAADAHELHRRRQQSTQDKRRVRRSAASTSS